MVTSREIYENFRQVYVQGKAEPVWFNIKTKQPANSEVAKVLSEAEEKLDPREKLEAVEFLKVFPSEEKQLPKMVSEGKGDSKEAGLDLPRMAMNLVTGAPKTAAESISAATGMSGGSPILSESAAATPIKPITAMDDLDIDRPDFADEPDSIQERENNLIQSLETIFTFAVDKLTSIDKNISNLVSLYKEEEKEEDVSEIAAKDEAKKEKQKEDAELIKKEKEESVDKLVEKAESLESENDKEKPLTRFQKARREFGENLRLNLAGQLPLLKLFSDRFDPNKIGSEEERQEIEEKRKNSSGTGILGMLGLGAAGGVAGGAATKIGLGALAAKGAVATGGAALAAGTGLSLGYLSDATGVSSFLSRNILGTSKEEADKAAAQRVDTATKTLDDLLGVKRVMKEDGTLDYKKTWGFEDPLKSISDALGDNNPFAPTGAAAAKSIPKSEVTKAATTLEKTAQMAKKAERVDSQARNVVINNNYNTLNQGGTTVTSINAGSHGGPLGAI